MNWLFLYVVVVLVMFNNIKPWEAPFAWATVIVCAAFSVHHQRRINALQKLAYMDALTGAWNCNAGMELLEREISRARRSRQPMSVAYMDLDKFKHVNDTFGHEVGDIVLRKAVDQIRKICRTHDLIIRKGGDEFLIIFPGLDFADLKRKVEQLSRVVQVDVLHLRVGASFGITALTDEDTVDSLLDRADSDMYQNKSRRRSAIH
jgi:diguanylate cyclase (GGDEF)-like protein